MWVAVVGPSGAGKDTLLSRVRVDLVDDPRFHFARRAITRAADAGGEDHEALDQAAFERRDFVLRWQAHGLLYGIPREEAPRGKVTVMNLSRGVLAEAASLAPLLVAEVTAPPALLAARLALRGRESAADIAARLTRDAPLPPGLAVRQVINDGPVNLGVARLRAVLEEACEQAGIRP
ncbi:MAG: phosphonate metabolism protein/1,5-bisphosphokinase (PRPP-forming) PhnN [Acetobacteraceae bacterium]|nr:phosphonate metabolism protein/1,5-bisphosphokinase (PRPP-forming) PhnN [Acetobacteraceae bacterium]